MSDTRAADYRHLAALHRELAAQATLPGSQEGHAGLASCYEAVAAQFEVAAQLDKAAENVAASDPEACATE
jgi:hypothetical protein